MKGVKRPKVESYEGKTPALGDAQARHLLKLPAGDSLKSLRDRALLSVLLYHGLRREEVLFADGVPPSINAAACPHLQVYGKGGKIRNWLYPTDFSSASKAFSSSSPRGIRLASAILYNRAMTCEVALMLIC